MTGSSIQWRKSCLSLRRKLLPTSFATYEVRSFCFAIITMLTHLLATSPAPSSIAGVIARIFAQTCLQCARFRFAADNHPCSRGTSLEKQQAQGRAHRESHTARHRAGQAPTIQRPRNVSTNSEQYDFMRTQWMNSTRTRRPKPIRAAWFQRKNVNRKRRSPAILPKPSRD